LLVDARRHLRRAVFGQPFALLAWLFSSQMSSRRIREPEYMSEETA